MLTLGLVACQREPMVCLSEENRAILESKINGNPSEEQGTQDEEIESSLEESQATTDQTQSVEDIRANWLEAETGSVFDFDSYMPYQMNQIKTFSDGNQSLTTYMTYPYEDLSGM